MIFEFTNPTLAFACLQQLVSNANNIDDKLEVLDDAMETGVASTIVEAVRAKTIEEEMNISIRVLRHTKKALEITMARRMEAYRDECNARDELIGVNDDKRKEAITKFAFATKATQDARALHDIGQTIFNNGEKTITRLALLGTEFPVKDTFGEFAGLVLAAKKQEEIANAAPPSSSATESFPFPTRPPSPPRSPPRNFFLPYINGIEERRRLDRQARELRKLR